MKKGTKVIVQIGHGQPSPGELTEDHSGQDAYKVRLKGERAVRTFHEDLVAIVGPPDPPKVVRKRGQPAKRARKAAA